MMPMRILFFLLPSLIWAAVESEKPLENCRQKIEALVFQSQNRLIFPFPELNPGFSHWVGSAQGALEVLVFSERYRSVPENSPETFLYSNAVESCKSFAASFESQINQWLLWELGCLMVGLVCVGLFFYLLWWLAFR